VPIRFAFSFTLLLLVALMVLRAASLPSVPPAVPGPPPRTTLVAAGDILLGRQLGEEMEKTGDYSLAFRQIRETLAAAEITFGNLEGPFCEHGPYPSQGMEFRFRPRAVESLVWAGFAVLSVANNHFSDGGEACMRFSLEHLRRAGIGPVGAGEGFEEAHRGAVIERNGIRFAFLAYTYAARNDTPGSRRLVVAGRDPDRVRRDVGAALERADVVVVSLHDGAEYTQRVAPETQEFARAAIEAGAVAVLGHHPHVPQRVEQYRDGWIFYSLGNFVFQQNTPRATHTGLLARLKFAGAKLESVEAIPIVIEPFARPRLATSEESSRVLRSVGLSGPVLWTAAGARGSDVPVARPCGLPPV